MSLFCNSQTIFEITSEYGETICRKDFFQIAWHACTSPGLHTCSPGTGPALPSSPSPGTLRRLARPTCTVASFLSCTQSHPTMCGPRTLICEWTLPWKWVGVLLSRSWWYTRHPSECWFPSKKNKKKNVSGFISRQGQRLLQGGGCCHHLDRLAPRLRLHQHHACGSGGLNSQKRAAYSLHLHYILSFIVLHSTVPKAHSSDPNLQSAHWTIMQINDKCDIHLKELLWDGV